MDEQRPSYTDTISSEDWERTPANVKQLVEQLSQRLEQLEQQCQDLQNQQQLIQEQLNQN